MFNNGLINSIGISILFFFVLVLSLSTYQNYLSADSHIDGQVNMEFSFLPDFVHYQGTISSNNVPLENIQTGIDPLYVVFSSKEQILKVGSKDVNIAKGQFEFSSMFGNPIPGKYHIDVGPGIPHGVIFDVIVGGQIALGAITFDPKPKGGCTIPNCLNVTHNLELVLDPFPTPTPIPATPTPIPSINPSLYSGEIRIGSELIPDGVEIYLILADFESSAITKDGKYTVQLNPGTSNYLGVEFYMRIQGFESLTKYKFESNKFTSDTNFLFPPFDLIVPEKEPEPVILEEVSKEPIVVATPTSTATPLVISTPTQISTEAEGGGCNSDGGGNSSISIFSIMIAMLIGFLYVKPKRA